MATTETHSEAQEKYGSFLGIEPELQAAEESQEEVTPSSDESAEAAETETEEAAETEEGQEEGEEATAEEAEAQATDPELEKFLNRKGLSQDDFWELAERYGITPQTLKDNPKWKFFIWDKYNADQLASKAKASEPEKTQDQPAKPVDAADHVKNALKSIDQYNDPKVLEYFVNEFNAAGEKQDGVGQFKVLAAAANNLVETRFAQLMESMFDQVLEKKYSGFGQQWQSWKTVNEAVNTWQQMRERDPQLPESFEDLEKVAIKRSPSIAKLPVAERLELYAELGKKVSSDPQQVAKAAEKGKQQGLAAAKTAGAGKGLGVGKPKGQIGTKPAKEDPLADAIAEFNRGNDSFGGQRSGR